MKHKLLIICLLCSFGCGSRKNYYSIRTPEGIWAKVVECNYMARCYKDITEACDGRYHIFDQKEEREAHFVAFQCIY